jgi:threonine/homoserine/homoserine lactone efflux protein
MIATLNFLIGFAFSFIGSIPPGTINLTIVQLGLEKKINIAWRFAIAASIMEYPYAWVAVEFAEMITSSPLLVENMQLITAIVMTLLGVITIWSSNRPTKISTKLSESGYMRGIILSILNPLAIPFWVGATAYLVSLDWIELSTPVRLHSYLTAICLGTFVILILLAYLAKKVVSRFQQNSWINRIPGIALIILGVYAFLEYLF